MKFIENSVVNLPVGYWNNVTSSVEYSKFVFSILNPGIFCSVYNISFEKPRKLVDVLDLLIQKYQFRVHSKTEDYNPDFDILQITNALLVSPESKVVVKLWSEYVRNKSFKKSSRPSDISEIFSIDIFYEPETNISELVQSLSKIKPKILLDVKTTISVLSTDSVGPYFKNIELKSEDFENLDVYYGVGFSEFHENLVSRIENSSKGLVLFHGKPGTGKTYYIRNLVKSLTNKSVIYIPSNMSRSLVEPSFQELLTEEVSASEKECVILIEDAEPILENRKKTGRSDDVSIILNLTDGILNDLLNTVIIATFNTELKNIDEALLRPSRLIARKEFLSLTQEQAQKICELRGKELPNIKFPCTTAELFEKLSEKEILVHGYIKNETKIGF